MSIIDSLQESHSFRIAEQLREANKREKGQYPFVTCYGHKPPFPTYPIWKMYRCYHCGEFFCEQCAKGHFGKRPNHLADMFES